MATESPCWEKQDCSGASFPAGTPVSSLLLCKDCGSPLGPRPVWDRRTAGARIALFRRLMPAWTERLPDPPCRAGASCVLPAAVRPPRGKAASWLSAHAPTVRALPFRLRSAGLGEAHSACQDSRYVFLQAAVRGTLCRSMTRPSPALCTATALTETPVTTAGWGSFSPRPRSSPVLQCARPHSASPGFPGPPPPAPRPAGSTLRLFFSPCLRLLQTLPCYSAALASPLVALHRSRQNPQSTGVSSQPHSPEGS